jgi:hypothetical protein
VNPIFLDSYPDYYSYFRPYLYPVGNFL